MFVDLLEYEWMLKPIVEFDSTPALIQELQDEIVSPAEKRIETRQAKLKELFGQQTPADQELHFSSRADIESSGWMRMSQDCVSYIRKKVYRLPLWSVR